MKMKRTTFLLSLMLAAAACTVHAEGLSLKAKKTKATKVEPVYIQKIGATAENGEGTQQELEGIFFLFEISKLKKNDRVLYMQELRDFTIDGVSYAQMTQEQLGLEVEPQSEIIESSKLIADNPAIKKILKNEKNGLAMQTAIYGTALPASGTVTVTLQVGWAELNEAKTDMVNGSTEDFTFTFDLASLVDEERPAEITEQEKAELLRRISAFRDDTDFSLDNLKGYSDIIAFASENEAVHITLGPDSFPEEVSKSSYAPVFLLAYVCGNLEAQLQSGSYTNRPEAGIAFELLKYGQLKEQDPSVSIRFFEDRR